MWEEICYPPADPALRRPPMLWATSMLVGHAGIAAWSLSKVRLLAPLAGRPLPVSAAAPRLAACPAKDVELKGLPGCPPL